MNELYKDSMAAAVDRLYAEVADDPERDRRRRRQRQEDLLRRRQPQGDGPGDQGRRARDLRDGRGDQGLAAPARDLPAPGRRRDQRRRARRRLRDHPRLQPPRDRRRPQGRGRPARGVARPAARRRRRHPRDPDARHPVRPDGRAAAGHPLQARHGPGEGPRRRAGRDPRGAGAGREGVDQGQPRLLAEPVGRRRLQDARRYAEPPQARGVPAGVPGAAAQADQGRGLPRPAGDPLGRGRGRAGRLRHRVADRVALPDQADRRPELEEHDPGVLLRPAGDQRRQAAARGHPAVPGGQGRRARRRDDGRRHRLLLRPRRHGGRAQGRRASRTPRRARRTARSCSTRPSPEASRPRRRRPSCSAGSRRPRTRPTSPAATS